MWNLLIWRFMEDMDIRRRNFLPRFWTWIKSFRIQLQEKSPSLPADVRWGSVVVTHGRNGRNGRNECVTTTEPQRTSAGRLKVACIWHIERVQIDGSWRNTNSFFWRRFYCRGRRLKVPLKGHVPKSVMRVQSCACCFAYQINCSCLCSGWRHRRVWLSSLSTDLPFRLHSQHAADSPPDVKFIVILRLFGLIFLVQIKYKR